MPEQLPFGIEIQHQLLRMMLDDEVFCHAIQKHIKPEIFGTQMLGWVCAEIVAYYDRYQSPPSFAFLRDQTLQFDAEHQKLSQLLLTQIESVLLRDRAYVRDSMIQMIRRQRFAEALQESIPLFQENNLEECFQKMSSAMDDIHRDLFTPPDQSFFFEDFEKRRAERESNKLAEKTITTGLPRLDEVLNGGLSEGELGLIIAPPKVGKSSFLIHLGATAAMAGHRVLHVVLEGSRRMIEDRYESAFNDCAYHHFHGAPPRAESLREFAEEVKAQKAGLPHPRAGRAPTTEEITARYKDLQGRLVIRAFTDRWDVNITDIENVLVELDRYHGWKPDMICVDYGDLMKGRGNYSNDYAQQRDVFRDLMALAKRGYAVWTASQSRRPSADDTGPITASQIADSYEKVRVASFICSVNRTPEESQQGRGTIFAELYRDGVAGMIVPFIHEKGHFLWREYIE